MKQLTLMAVAVIIFASCSSDKKKENSTTKKEKKEVAAEYLVSKDGIGELKIGMTQAEIEKLINQSLVMKHDKEAEVWMDTTTAKYKDIDVTLFFEKQYAEDENSPRIMQLSGISTSSPKCRTATGLGVGDDKMAIIEAYDNSPIDLGPEYFMVNDTTWEPSKTKFYVNVKDDKYDKQLVFKLENKKITALEATLFIGE